MPTGNTQQVINYGASANDGQGDPLRTAFIKTDDNFDNIWLAGPAGSNVRITNNTIGVLDTNDNLILSPNGIGIVQTNNHLVPRTNKTYDLGSANLQYRTLYANSASVQALTISGDLTVPGNLIVGGDIIELGNIVTDTLTIQLANTAATANAANGAGVTVGADDNIATLLYRSTSNVWTTNIGLNSTGNITAPYFIGNGFALTSLAGANVTGTVANATYSTSAGTSGTVTANAQPNITSVGTLTSLSVTGNITAANLGNIVSLNLNGNASTVLYGNGTFAASNNYGNANVVANLAALGTNPISTTGNVSAGNVLTSAEIIASGVVQSGTGLSTGGYLSVNGSTDLHDTNIIGTLSVNTIKSDDSTIVLIEDGVDVDGNVTADYFIGNGSQLTGLPATYGNANVANYLPTFSGNISAGNVSASGNVTGLYIKGNGSELTNLPAPAVAQDIVSTGDMSIMTYDGNLKYVSYATVEPASGNIKAGNISTTGNITGGNILTNNYFYANGSPFVSSNYGNANVATFLAAYGSNTITTTGNITAGNLIGNISITSNVVGTQANVTLVAGSYSTVFDNTGNLTLPGNTFAVNYANNTPVNVVTRVESSWTVPVGTSTQSFTVGANETYYLWVDCNIPNGILVWNATATVTNTNVPVVGAQYAWVYDGGGTPIDFTSIPNQFVGTANAIVRSNTAPSSTTNRFDFGINNTSGGNVTVRYGWIQIS